VEGFFLLFLDILGGHTCGDISCYSYKYILLFHGVLAWSKPYFALISLDLLCGDGPLSVLGFCLHLVERSIHLASTTFIHGVGYLGTHTCEVVACMHILGGRISCGDLAFDLV
jgi:hypothetical protein